MEIKELEKDIIAYKAAFIVVYKNGEYIAKPVVVKLLIPAGAFANTGVQSQLLLSFTVYNKRRANMAIVKKIYSYDMKYAYKSSTIAHSNYSHRFTYQVGETVVPTMPFDMNPLAECSSGIHFLDSRYQAMSYFEDYLFSCGLDDQDHLKSLYEFDKMLRRESKERRLNK